MKRMITFLLAFAFITTSSIGQTVWDDDQTRYFTKAAEGFSKKKPAYITLMNGDEIEGKLKRAKRKKGLFKEIKIEVDGKEMKLMPEDIKNMYLPESGLSKMGKFDFANAMDYSQTDINQEHLKDGYAFFESAEVQIKKKKRQVLLMQLVNPAIASKVRVYHDPFASETAKFGVGGMTLAGGNEKSYYVKKGDEIAYKLKKKDYKKQYESLFGDCKEFMRKSLKKDDKPSWKKFGANVAQYSQSCNSEKN